MIAEEVGKAVPKVVTYEENGIDAKTLDYGRLTPILVEAIEEQQKQIESLMAQNSGSRSINKSSVENRGYNMDI
ncbi:MAG: hypothetical protein WA063_03265 [Minisyncoccia bacterium]